MLAQLPAPIREAFQAAVTGGVQSAFLWAAVVALVAIVAAFVIRQVTLRSAADGVKEVPVESVAV
jgi:hypothetical protein